MTPDVTAKAIHRVLAGDAQGQGVTETLISLFDARLSYVPGDTHATAFREGQRSVVRWLLEVIASVEAGEPKLPRVN